MRYFLTLTAVLIFSAGLVLGQHPDHKMPETQRVAKPIELVSTDAITHRKVATSITQAQAFFDQGLTLYYAFNDGDAVRSFRRAADLDPQLAMAYWGVALAAYPRSTGGGNPSDEKRLMEARDAIKMAMSMPSPSSDRIYIEALSKLFPDEAGTSRAASDEAYRLAMKPIYAASPKDADAAALYALSIFYAAGDTVWTPDGKPIGHWQEMLDVLESGLKLYPKHLGLTHIYIHGVEESLQPERALAAADALRGLKIFTPSFGHLVHMPAHIYVRTGNFQKSVDSNEQTATMPTDTLSEEFRLWHYNHVLNFLLFSYGMQGNFAGVTHTLDRTFGFKSPRSIDRRPRYWVRFKHWDDILKAPAPPADSRPQNLTNWTWARTMAFIGTGQTANAETEREVYRAAAKKQTDELTVKAASEQIVVFANTTSMDEALIDAAFARSRGDKKAEIEFLQKAVTAEDKLPYSEPPISISPIRESLGGALLRDGQNAEAEKVFREDLRRNPGSGRSLFGLMTSLEFQGKKGEASTTRKQFQKAWKYADFDLTVNEL
jgi:tetratricopeptide (TPR) repeat protein